MTCRERSNMEEEIREGETKELGLRDLQKVLVRCWWIMLAAAIVLAGATYLFLHITHKDVYTATAKIWVMRENTTIQGDKSYKSATDVSIANNIITDVADTAKDNLDVRTEAEKETGLSLDAVTLKVSSNEDSHVVKISVTSDNKDAAYNLANALMTQTCKKINDLMEGDFTKPYDSVKKPEKPSNSISKLAILLAGFIGAAVVYVVFLVLHLLNDKINDADDVQNLLGISVLGEIPNEHDVSTHKKRYGSYYYRHYKAYQAPTEQQGGTKQ